MNYQWIIHGPSIDHQWIINNSSIDHQWTIDKPMIKTFNYRRFFKKYLKNIFYKFDYVIYSYLSI